MNFFSSFQESVLEIAGPDEVGITTQSRAMEQKGVMWKLFHYITQIKPLENGKYQGVLKRHRPTSTKC